MTVVLNHAIAPETWLEAVVTGLPLNIVVTDPKGIVQLLNAKAASRLGVDAEAAVGQPLANFLNIFDEEMQMQHGFPIGTVLALNQSMKAEKQETLVFSDGLRHRLNYQLEPLRQKDGQALGVMLSFPDLEESGEPDSGKKQGIQLGKDASQAFYVRSNGKYLRVWLKDLLWIEAMENYIQLKVGNEKLVVHATLKSVQELLSSRGFVRIHRSFVVKLDAIESIEENHVTVGDHSLPIGKSFRSSLLEALTMV